MMMGDQNGRLADALANAAKAEDYLAMDIATLQKIDFHSIFIAPVEDSRVYGRKVHNILSDWEVHPDIAPSMRSIMLVAAESLNIDKKSSEFKAALKAADLGHTPAAEEAEFHAAPDHPRKVLLQVIRLMSSYNYLVEKGIEEGPALSGKEMSLLMATAAIHDLGHDGKGNGMKEAHQQYRLEDQSFNLFKEKLGDLYSDEDLETIHLMLRCTDPSSYDGPLEEKSPLVIMRQFYNDPTSEKNLPKNLSGLTDSRKLLYSMILNTGDMGSSTSLCVERTRIESGLFGIEMGLRDIASDAGSASFIPKVKISDLPAADAVYGNNSLHIVAALEGAVQIPIEKPSIP